ncbi:MAG: tetratricopeptide repeat protein [Pseudomonadales bacterium]|nr:tetratricopeptide repeat protein [Pseudomonadales bacterium]
MKIRVCSIIWLFIVTLCIGLPGVATANVNNPRNQVGFYIETYGRIAPESNQRAALAHDIFARVRHVADSNQRHMANLEIVDSPADPWAISLPDGYIILSKGAIDLCFEIPAIKETCLAFILGHELAHIANDDFWHQEVSRFLSTSSNAPVAVKTLQKRQQQASKELAADDKGFIYAAMAGYPVNELLKVGQQNKDFFHFWSQQTSASIISSNATLKVRADLLRKRLNAIESKLDFFSMGVRLAHFDYCDDAIHFFKEFQQTYPGREVLNNLGFCHLQVARQKMPPNRAYFYWMPLQLEGETRASSLTQRGTDQRLKLRDMDIGVAKVDLEKAINYLQQAITIDPYYLPARLNLAVAYLYNSQPHQARATLDEARALAPENLDIQGLEAITIYEQSDSLIDLLPNALARLEELANKQKVPSNIVFNLLRLQTLNESAAKVKTYSDKLLAIKEKLPEPILLALCESISSSSSECFREKLNSARSTPSVWPLPNNNWQQLTVQIKQKYLAGWTQIPFDWGVESLNGTIYSHPNKKAAALELDQFLQMQIVKDKHSIPIESLKDYCMQPIRTRHLPSGNLRSCNNWAALTQNNTVKELWWVAR